MFSSFWPQKNWLNTILFYSGPPRILRGPVARNIKSASCNSYSRKHPKHSIILSPKFLNVKPRYPIWINQFVYGQILQNHFTSIQLCFVISIKQEDCILLTDTGD